ncbi:MAG: PD-(D/E)XK nuclease family protein [archaeon]
MITFIKEGHRYVYNETGKELQPSTDFIAEFFEKFDTERWSRHIALRDGMSVQAVLDMWEKKKNDSCDFGTNVHSYAESLIRKTDPPEPRTKAEEIYFNAVDRFFETEDHEFIEAEKIIGSPAYGLAGQIDAVSKTDKGIWLVDWKTNKSIDVHAYMGKKALKPIDHLEDCNFSKYSLQLSLYRYMLEKEMKVAGLLLVHLLPNGRYEKYKVDYLRKEVERMLAFTGRL